MFVEKVGYRLGAFNIIYHNDMVAFNIITYHITLGAFNITYHNKYLLI